MPDSRILPTKFAVAGQEVYLTDDKQVSKKIIVAGEFMPIQKGQKIAMDYEGRLKEKIWEVFDSSEFPKPF